MDYIMIYDNILIQSILAEENKMMAAQAAAESMGAWNSMQQDEIPPQFLPFNLNDTIEIAIKSLNNPRVKMMHCVAKDLADNHGGLWRCQTLPESDTWLTLTRSSLSSRQAVFSLEDALWMMTYQKPLIPDASATDLETLFMMIANSTHADATSNWKSAAHLLWNAVPDSTTECEAMVSAKRLKNLFAVMSDVSKEGKCPESVWQAGVLYIVAAKIQDDETDH